MTLMEATDLLLKIEEALELTYGEAFKTFPNSKTRVPRFGWEVRIAAGAAKLEKAALQLRSAVGEASPKELIGI